jgi:hypothetical protein
MTKAIFLVMNIFDLPPECLYEIILSTGDNLAIGLLSLVSHAFRDFVTSFSLMRHCVLKYDTFIRQAAKSNNPHLLVWIKSYRWPSWAQLHDMQMDAVAGSAIDTLHYLEEHYPYIKLPVDRLRKNKITYTGEMYRYLKSKDVEIWHPDNMPFSQLTDQEIYDFMPPSLDLFILEYVFNMYSSQLSLRLTQILSWRYGMDAIYDNILLLTASAERAKILMDAFKT